MGTKVQYKSSLSGYYSMRDLNEDSDACSWPLYHPDKTFSNGHHYNTFLPTSTPVAYAYEYDKDAVKRTMIEHEAVFKNQVYELHRLYRIQRDMMDEVSRTELNRNHFLAETTPSSSPLASQITSEDTRKWHLLNFPLTNSAFGTTSTSVADHIPSPFSSFKGNDIQPSQFSSPNGHTSKEADALNPRPSKLRRKAFDLELPAEEYIDTDEGGHCREVSEISGRNRVSKLLPESGAQHSYRDGGKSIFQGDTSRYGSCLNNEKGLADLNEPVRLEEEHTSSYAGDLGHTLYHADIQCQGFHVKSMSQPLGLRKEFETKSIVKNNHISNGFDLENEGNGLYRHFYSGHSNGYPKPDFQAQSDKFPVYSQPPKDIISRSPATLTFFLTEQNRENQWTNPSSISLDQRPVSAQMHPYLNPSATLSKNLDSESRAHANLRHGWYHYSNNSTSLSNTSFVTELSGRNGFYHGSSSQCKQLKPRNQVNLNIPVSENATNEPVCNSPAVFPWLKANSGCMNKPIGSANEKNTWNSSFLQSSSFSDKNMLGKIHNELSPQTMKPLPPSSVMETCRSENIECPSNRKIPGFPICGKSQSSNDSSLLTSQHVPPQQSDREVEDCRKNILVLDINLPCDCESGQQLVEEFIITKEVTDKNVGSFRQEFDLNSRVSEDDDCLILPSVSRQSIEVLKNGIDLESPALVEEEDNSIPGKKSHNNEASLQDKTESPQDEIMRTVAETIVTISSLKPQKDAYNPECDTLESSTVNPLQWFAEIVTCIGKDSEKKVEKSDYFEYMTLKLSETKEEDYMPTPLVPENLKREDPEATVVMNRTRKGQGRRGRLRRDFQRDILVGLASLSRLEVTEDLQTFGGIMKATGHSWQRRNSSGNGTRGRRRCAPPLTTSPACTQLIEQLSKVDVAIDDRSITGWGKTTRRPRRQRCPPGNPQMRPLT